MQIPMIQSKIEALLQDKIGVAASIIGSKEITRAVEKRRLACNLPNLQTYLQQLQTSTQELEELIELVIVPETWFFRDGEPFIFLKHYVTSEWLPTQSNRILRLLSVPCSSGEEPYSIAMTLLNAGLTPNQFCIDGVDISKKSLHRARRAVYSRNSFRGNKLEFQERYFTKTGDEYQLCDLVKNVVNFIHGNLLNSHFWINRQPYDIIFCRNVLIYFEQPARELTLQNLERLLTNQGLIFVGHAEAGQLLQSRFESMRHPMAFAYRKKDNKNDILQDKEKSKIRNPLIAPLQEFRSKPDPDNSDLQRTFNQVFQKSKAVKSQNLLPEKLSSKKKPTEKKKSYETQNSTLNLETVRRLADCGQLDEATLLGETYLKQNHTNVEAYVLLGEVYQAKGLEEQAEQCFQKAIYLEPNSYEALMHLALLKEHRGDVARAVVLRQRIQRLQKF